MRLIKEFRNSGVILARGVVGFVVKKIQSRPGYRRVGKRLLPWVAISEANLADLRKIHVAQGNDIEGPPPTLGPAHTIYVARLKQTILGWVYLVRQSPIDSCYIGPWFYGLHVWPVWRGLGIGELLLRRILDRARKENASGLYCFVFVDNYAALNLYYKLGFARVIIPPLERVLEEEHRTYGKRRIVLCKAL